MNKKVIYTSIFGSEYHLHDPEVKQKSNSFAYSKKDQNLNKTTNYNIKRSKFRSLILDKNFEEVKS